VLQWVAVGCSVVQETPREVCRSVLQCVAVRCSELQCIVVWCSVVCCGEVCCSVWQGIAGCCNVLQYVALCCVRRFAMDSV